MLSSAPVRDVSNAAERHKLVEFLTKTSDADESFAGFRTFHENIQLSGQLFALGTILLGFTSDAGHEVGWHGRDRNRGKDIVEWGDELGFDDFDSDIVHETFQGNLIKRATQLTMRSTEVEENVKKGNGRPCSKPSYNPKLRNMQSGSCQVPYVPRELSRAGGDLCVG